MTSPHAVASGIRLLARLLPVPPLESVTPLSLDELKVRYRTRDRVLNVIGCAALAVVAVGIYWVLVAAAERTFAPYAGAPYVLRTGKPLLAVLAGFLSLGTTGSLVMLGCRLYFGNDEFRRYITYCAYHSPPGMQYNLERAFQYVLLLCALPLAYVSMLLIDEYLVLTPTEVIESPFWSYGPTIVHPYEAVRRVCEIRAHHGNFEDVVRPFQLIEFTDGTRWTSPQGKGGSVIEYQRQLIQFASERSGKPILYYGFIEDMPP